MHTYFKKFNFQPVPKQKHRSALSGILFAISQITTFCLFTSRMADFFPESGEIPKISQESIRKNMSSLEVLTCSSCFKPIVSLL